MPSYSSYKRQMAVLDAKNDNIESWITVKGNHIPIMKGQSKEDAVKSFLAGKSDKASAKRESKPTSAGEATKKVVEQAKKNQEIYKEHKKQETAKKTDKKLAERSNKPEHISEATKRVEQTVKGEQKPDTAPLLNKAKEFEKYWDRQVKDTDGKGYTKAMLRDAKEITEGLKNVKSDADIEEVIKDAKEKLKWWKKTKEQVGGKGMTAMFVRDLEDMLKEIKKQ